MAQPLRKTAGQSLMKLSIPLSPNLAIVFLSMDPKEQKTYVHIKNSIQIFALTLSTVDKTWSEPV